VTAVVWGWRNASGHRGGSPRVGKHLGVRVAHEASDGGCLRVGTFVLAFNLPDRMTIPSILPHCELSTDSRNLQLPSCLILSHLV
jgi:hypothetical protein